MSESRFIDDGRGLVIDLPDGEQLDDVSLDVIDLLSFDLLGEDDDTALLDGTTKEK